MDNFEFDFFMGHEQEPGKENEEQLDQELQQENETLETESEESEKEPENSNIEAEQEREVTERMYYTINEGMAKYANDANSFNDYKSGSATAIYKAEVNEAYDIVDRIQEKKPKYYKKAVNMAEYYSRKLAAYYNDYYKNEASCPSVLISGRGNFPTKKKEKQNAKRDVLCETWRYLQKYLEKIKDLLYHTQPILSKEADAIEQLKEKLTSLETLQEKMKGANAYYRKNKTLDECPCLSEKEIQACKEGMESSYHYDKDKVFMSYELTNNNANIRRIKKRIETLEAEKERGTQETDNGFCKVVEDTDDMRLRLLFDGKPDEKVREILKSNGFKWSPKNEAWQRQLTNNARYSLQIVLKALSELEEGNN